VEIRSIVLHHR